MYNVTPLMGSVTYNGPTMSTSERSKADIYPRLTNIKSNPFKKSVNFKSDFFVEIVLTV